nr:MAG TPA: hypothetical protein [Bacteriophage sp.]
MSLTCSSHSGHFISIISPPCVIFYPICRNKSILHLVFGYQIL